MTNIVKLRQIRPFVTLRRGVRISAAIFVSSLIAPALALAHGGMGPEVGPPLLTSGVLGFICYWVVMLWPFAKKKNDQTVEVNGQFSLTSRPGIRSQARPVRVKRAPRLRKIEGRGQFSDDQSTRRKVSDG
jgi:hypothetical protein